ncbi:DUF1963 domain-containing protein [Terrihabitans sp. B22-R8]|uniref:DUF1963 domain-containing protein n=1 Tax=Terrihabitans sp. B22-R8 TaxID=3425128 RepID=UPI00403C0A82
MFDGLAEAAELLGQTFDPPAVERLVDALVPAIILKPSAPSAGRTGGTHLGGTPDVPPGFEWPRPPRPADAQEIADRGNSDSAKAMLAHIEANLPYAFIAQIDLEEASRLGNVARDLPSEGRLLFFYDHAVGPWDTGSRTARVIWENSPGANLAPLEMPDDLKEAARREAEEMASVRAEFGETWSDSGEEGTIYGAPKRDMVLTPILRMPHSASLEIERLAEFQPGAGSGEAADDTEDFRTNYEEALEEHHDADTKARWRRQQVLGSPQPEQGDPRLDAVVVSEFGQQHLPSEEWRSNYPRIKAQAANWQLLLQIDVADWMQARFVEGSVFFLIRKNDLRQRRFDAVLVVYQQT